MTNLQKQLKYHLEQFHHYLPTSQPTFSKSQQQPFFPSTPTNSIISHQDINQIPSYQKLSQHNKNLNNSDDPRRPTDPMWHSQTLKSPDQFPNSIQHQQLKLFNKIKSITYLNTQNPTIFLQHTSIQPKLINLNDPSIINAQSRDQIQLSFQQCQKITSTILPESEIKNCTCSVESKGQFGKNYYHQLKDNNSINNYGIIEKIYNCQYTTEIQKNKQSGKSKYAADYAQTFSSTPTNNYSSTGNNNQSNNLNTIRHPIILDNTNQQKISVNFHPINPIDQQNKAMNIVHPINIIPKQPTQHIERNQPLNIPLIPVTQTINTNIRINNSNNNIPINQHYITPQYPQKQYNIPPSQQNKKLYNITQLLTKTDGIARISRDLQVFNYNARNSYDQNIPSIFHTTSPQLPITQSQTLYNNPHNKTNPPPSSSHQPSPLTISNPKQQNSFHQPQQSPQPNKNLQILRIAQLLNTNTSISHHKKNYSTDLDQSKTKKKLVVTISSNHNNHHHSCNHVNKGYSQINHYKKSSPNTNIIHDSQINNIYQTPKPKNHSQSKTTNQLNRRVRNSKDMQWKVMMKGNNTIDDDLDHTDNKCPQWSCCQIVQQKKTLNLTDSKHLPTPFSPDLTPSLYDDTLSTTRCNLLQRNQILIHSNRQLTKNKSLSLQNQNYHNNQPFSK